MRPLATILSVTCIVLAYVSATERASPKTNFQPALKIDHKTYMDKALAYLLKERPDLKPTNLSCMGLDYRFNFAPGTKAVCGPNGCQEISVAPFTEKLSVSFQVLDSGKDMEEDGEKVTKYEGISVLFPSARRKDWALQTMTITSYH